MTLLPHTLPSAAERLRHCLLRGRNGAATAAHYPERAPSLLATLRLCVRTAEAALAALPEPAGPHASVYRTIICLALFNITHAIAHGHWRQAHDEFDLVHEIVGASLDSRNDHNYFQVQFVVPYLRTAPLCYSRIYGPLFRQLPWVSIMEW